MMLLCKIENPINNKMAFNVLNFMKLFYYKINTLFGGCFEDLFIFIVFYLAQ